MTTQATGNGASPSPTVGAPDGQNGTMPPATPEPRRVAGLAPPAAPPAPVAQPTQPKAKERKALPKTHARLIVKTMQQAMAEVSETLEDAAQVLGVKIAAEPNDGGWVYDQQRNDLFLPE